MPHRGLRRAPERGPFPLATVLDHHDDVRRAQIHPEPPGPVREPGGAGPRDQVVEQLAPDPALRLRHAPAEQQQQRAHQRRPLKNAFVGIVAAQHQRAQRLTTDVHGRDQQIAPAHCTPQRPRRLRGLQHAHVRLRQLARRAADRPPQVVQHGQRAAQHVRHHGRHVLDPAAAQHQRGHPVVRHGGPLDRLAVLTRRPVRARQLLQRVPGLLQQPGVVDRDGGVRGQARQQRHLLLVERPRAAVGRHEHADHPLPQPQRHPQDGDQALLGHRLVDVLLVTEPGVGEVVGRRVRRRRLRHQPAEARPHGQPQRPELGRDRPVGDPHVGVAPLGIVQRHVRDVRGQQLPGPVHDGLKDGVQVPQRGQVAGRVVERRQLGLAPGAPLEQVAYLERLDLGLLQLLDRRRVRPGRPGPDDRPLELDRRRLPRQQLKKFQGE